MKDPENVYATIDASENTFTFVDPVSFTEKVWYRVCANTTGKPIRTHCSNVIMLKKNISGNPNPVNPNPVNPNPVNPNPVNPPLCKTELPLQVQQILSNFVTTFLQKIHEKYGNNTNEKQTKIHAITFILKKKIQENPTAKKASYYCFLIERLEAANSMSDDFADIESIFSFSDEPTENKEIKNRNVKNHDEDEDENDDDDEDDDEDDKDNRKDNEKKRCTVYLDSNTHTCEGFAAISVLSLANHKSVVKVNTKEGNATKVSFTAVFYKSNRENTANIRENRRISDEQARYINIGDSVSNDGRAGDRGDQSNDAEVMLANNSFNVYASDYGKSALLWQDKNLFDFCNNKECTPSIEISITNTTVVYKKPGFEKRVESPSLFALNGQEDIEGEKNYDIYAGFNRTVGNTLRDGNGVNYVDITLE